MTMKRGSCQRFQYCLTVSSSALPFICIAPSPTIAITGLCGCAILAAIAYGTPLPMLASLPDSEPIMPRRSLMSRAYQLVCEPQSPHRITSCGSFGDSSQHTRCGLIGSADAIAGASASSHQRSEEGRVGQECDSTCRSRCKEYHE